jgi:predicted permease
MEVFLTILGEFSLFAFGTILAQATKYVLDSNFIWKVFWKTNLKPFIFTFISGVIIAAFSVFLPSYSMFVVELSGQDLEIDNMASLFSVAAVIGTILKSRFSTPTDKIKTEIIFDVHIKNNPL